MSGGTLPGWDVTLGLGTPFAVALLLIAAANAVVLWMRSRRR